MRVLVTGAAGFIGSHILEAARDLGYEVRGFDSLTPAVHDGMPSYIPADVDMVIASHNEPTLPSIVERVEGIVQGHWTSSSAATQVQLDAYASARDDFAPVLEKLRILIGVDLKKLEDQMEAAGAPWTPGRIPTLPPPAPK